MKLIKFYMDTCGPCKILEQYLQKGGFTYESVNLAKDSSFIDKYNIGSVPVLMIIDNEGNEVARNVGVMNCDEIRKFISDNGMVNCG